MHLHIASIQRLLKYQWHIKVYSLVVKQLATHLHSMEKSVQDIYSQEISFRVKFEFLVQLVQPTNYVIPFLWADSSSLKIYYLHGKMYIPQSFKNTSYDIKPTSDNDY